MAGLGQNPCFRPRLERQRSSSTRLPRLPALAQPQRLEIVYDSLLDLSEGSRRQNVLIRSREQRKNLRRFTRRAATLTLGDQKPSVDCVIWDISEEGARLAVRLPMPDLPQHFTLNLFRDERVRRQCEVVWTDRRFVGVKFTALVP
jgi:hypothetical protein